MFTGIIEEIGTLSRIEKSGKTMQISVLAVKILEDIHLGDSIAINGVCLTVTQFDRRSFSVDVMPETFSATALHTLSIGDRVNLERAMAANGRFGGHFVSGHVDGTGTIVQKQTKENALYMTIRLAQNLAPFLMERGSIAVDGTSLTLFSINGTDATISLIPHTQKETVLAKKNIGEPVNIECDMLAKYIHQMTQPQTKGNISLDMLSRNGFLHE